MGTSLAVRWLGLCFHCRGIPGQGTKISHAAWCSEEKSKRKNSSFSYNLDVITWKSFSAHLNCSIALVRLVVRLVVATKY